MPVYILAAGVFAVGIKFREPLMEFFELVTGFVSNVAKSMWGKIKYRFKSNFFQSKLFIYPNIFEWIHFDWIQFYRHLHVCDITLKPTSSSTFGIDLRPFAPSYSTTRAKNLSVVWSNGIVFHFKNSCSIYCGIE